MMTAASANPKKKRHLTSRLEPNRGPALFSELFFCFAVKIVRTDSERNPLTHTVTHITIVYSGHSSTKGCLLVTKPPKFEKP